MKLYKTDIDARARELLNGITSPPWKESLLDGVDYEDGSSCYRGGIYDTTPAHIPVFLASGGIDKRDARFIAAAPELVAELLDQLDQANAALKRVRALCEPVLTEYVDDGEPVLAQAILDALDGAR